MDRKLTAPEIRDEEERRAAFDAWFHSDARPQGHDRVVLDIAFTAGWRAKRNNRSKR